MSGVDTSPSVGLVQHMIECGRSPDTKDQRVWPNWQVADALEAHAERATEAAQARIAELEKGGGCVLCAGECRGHSLGDSKAWEPEEGSRDWMAAEIATLRADLAAAREALDAANYENGTLKAIVQGWHYLAVGPDEMGDYYTHKQLVKASEPYASPALRKIKENGHDA